MTLNPATDLTFSRNLAVPPHLVWTCWTTPEHIREFFIPAPHKVSACEIDLRVGGRFNTTFEVDGNMMENHGVFLEIIDGAKLVFTDFFREGWEPVADPFMVAIIEIEDDGVGGTRYTATARHRSEESRKAHEDMGFYEGWGTVAEQLEAYAKAL